MDSMNLERELERWQRDGLAVRLWLRDDDAISDSEALRRLLDVTGTAGVPISLAAIPALVDALLPRLLADQDHVRIAVHGYAHVNHAPAGEKKQELGPHRPAAAVLGELAHGFARLDAMFGDRLDPLLVPPWNRIAGEVARGLPGIGLEWLSTFARHDAASAVNGLRQLNCHVDLIAWRGGRSGKPWPRIADELADALREARAAGGRPVGILAHHLVHDDTAWSALARLLGLAPGGWHSFRQLADAADAPPPASGPGPAPGNR